MFLELFSCSIHWKAQVFHQSLAEGALRKLHLHLFYHLKEVHIVALLFYLYNMRLEEYVAIK